MGALKLMQQSNNKSAEDNPTYDDLNLKKKKRKRNASNIYGALDRELLEKQSTKVTENEGSEIVRLKSLNMQILQHSNSPKEIPQ